MVNADKSGIMFSINPVTNDQNQIVIEAIRGLGEAVVSGAVSPNTYVVDKKSLEIVEKDIPPQEWMLIRDEFGRNKRIEIPSEERQKQVLSDFEIKQLAKLAIEVERHYGFPQDMEWAIEKNRIYLVQARPVTTIRKPKEKVELTAEPILKGLGASPGIGVGPVKIIHSASELDKIEKGDVLVTRMTNPDMVPAMQKAAAIVTDEGGITCHAAIVSREMGVPCVVGTESATEKLKDGQIITVDGTHGLVYAGRVKLEVEKKEEEYIPAKIITATQVKVIMDLPEFAKRAAETDADGIGLLRLEGIIASGKKHPAKYLAEGKLNEYSDLLYKGIKEIVQYFREKPVWIRTSDIRTDEYRELEGAESEPHESNPMLGWHGIRRSLDQPELLKAELAAIKKLYDEGFKKIGIMLPFVISVEEVRAAKKILREVGLEPSKDIQFGVMIETPASVWIIEELCKEGIDFISFGTNDLTQTTLGVDRNNAKIAHLYDWMHPAVLREIKYVLEVCKKYGVETSICGQAGSDPKMVEFLVRNGIDSVSANPDAVEGIRKIVFMIERKLLLEAARRKLA